MIKDEKNLKELNKKESTKKEKDRLVCTTLGGRELSEKEINDLNEDFRKGIEASPTGAYLNWAEEVDPEEIAKEIKFSFWSTLICALLAPLRWPVRV